jgi:hypothetical protein
MFLSAGFHKSFVLTSALIGLGIVLSSCQNGIAFAQPAASKTLPVVPSLTATPQPPTITATASRTPTATLTRTPPALPSPLAAKELKKGVQPYTYIPNTCEYLKNRWDPNKSQPGTVVMPVMYHSITED